MSKKRNLPAKAVQPKSRRNAPVRTGISESQPRSARFSAPSRIAAKTAPPNGKGKANGAGKNAGKLDAVP